MKSTEMDEKYGISGIGDTFYKIRSSSRVNSAPVFMIIRSLVPSDGAAVGGRPALYLFFFHFLLMSFSHIPLTGRSFSGLVVTVCFPVENRSIHSNIIGSYLMAA